MTKTAYKNPEADIPHIFHIIPSFAPGGVPIRICYLMNHFGTRARHSILATDGLYSCRSRLSEAVDYQIADIRDAGAGNIFRRLHNYRRILKDIKPDLLLTYNWGSTEWALANNVRPICRHFHLESGFGPEEALATMPRRNWFRRAALRNIEGLIVPSRNLVKICKSDWHIPDHKIRYIANGVDCAKYGEAPMKGIIPGFVKGENEITVGTMTPLRAEKNLPRLITAFKKLTETCPDDVCRLIIMGEGKERQRLEKMRADYGLTKNILLPGHIDDPAHALGWLDIYALSSDTEQMPNSLNQAMAAGLPIVGLDVGDVKYMMPAQNKPFIAPAGDDETFAQALIKLARNKGLRNDLSQINKSHVKKTFDQQGMFDAYARVWGVI